VEVLIIRLTAQDINSGTSSSRTPQGHVVYVNSEHIIWFHKEESYRRSFIRWYFDVKEDEKDILLTLTKL
jgi:hypothetical protein